MPIPFLGYIAGREVAVSCGNRRSHGSVGPGHVGMAQCRLSPCLVILSVSEGRVSGTLQGTAHPRRGQPHPRPLPNP